MTAPEAALAAALHKIGLGCLRPIEASRDVCVPGTRPGSIHDGAPEALTAALHDAGYALTPLAPEVPPRRELPPDFPIFGVGNRRIPGMDRHDRCSIHGEIGLHTSIAAHLLAAHGMTYEQYGTLAELYGVRDRDLYDEEDAAATRTPEPPARRIRPQGTITHQHNGWHDHPLVDLGDATAATEPHVHRRRAEPPDSGDGAAPDCEAVKSTLARLVLHPAPTIASRSFRVALAEGLRLLGYEAADPDEYTPEPRDAGIDAALLARANANVLRRRSLTRNEADDRWVAEVTDEYARLGSGSPAPEGGE